MADSAAIRITWLGHSCFKLETEGYSVVLDPYGDGVVPGYGPLREQANEVLCSHGHRDHNAVETVELVEGGTSPFQVTEIPVFHDDKEGALRGVSTIRVFSCGGLKVAHMGDIGCPLTKEQSDALRGLDAILIPVGGYYTIDAEQAAELVKEIHPRVIIPMHYRSERFGYDVLGPVDPFLEQFDVVVEYPGNQLEISADTDSHVAVLQYES